ncbi:precorrin-4 C(11)-methyltransferase [Corynebacterium sp. ES2794-CONJ1]|uniref:precorrin-4 C(11)-methyltransferase n=1 Tax=unclassified Corynebacterium TaxID=2624378 RepID=UPI002168CF5B|nr:MULTISPECIES: precorrin-4 C(11)-methyltransferase [unclassified Corynebacterium]MCS4489351.1 precorrin-4 C(11)-methyltransferase [Corynebacterium sp. ES2775-CONJ]MCS4491164.1 precorrin-4 C(11)-methyltransferase [Corynebacterium sp. ES2715-CONJ3]MCS4530955.1 precorrin-4 C(11)-methyltransferase [Corynebacterium sp. ES2730-CONJ]MCU9518322.1 precorrin-4 C(11)-methyltransferase [Corynebacterium sp. ES2794-CONJ1]
MTVYFIGAGPGASDLLTVRADRLIRQADLCLYAGSIIPQEVLDSAPEHAELINTARMPLDTIVEIIAQAHAQHKKIVRLQSGDPSIYSALAEQVRRLTARGIDYEIVPGVPAFAAAAASLGHELTVPTVGQSVILTRVSGRASAMPEGEDLATLSQARTTLCIHLAAHDINRVVTELLPFYGAQCPVAVVAFASRENEKILRGTLGDIAAQILEAGITRTAIIVVGKVLGASGFPDSFLYSDDRPRDEEGRTLPCVL